MRNFMKIRKIIETPEGEFEFSGEINDAEHELILEAGINFLLQQGVIPFKVFKKEKDKVAYVPPQEGQGTQ